MFEFLFNYRPELFAEGRLTFLAGPFRTVLVALGVIALAWMLIRYQRSLKDSPKADGKIQGLLMAIRLVGALALLFALMQPALTLRAVKPQESFVAVLADSSASMTIADTDQLDRAAASRGAWLQDALLGETENSDRSPGRVWSQLADRFHVRAYSFSENVERLQPADRLDFTGRSSDLGLALETARAELTGVPLAGVVILTDGAIGRTDLITDETLRYRSAGIPIFPVTLGSRNLTRDLEVESVRMPDRSLLGSTVEAEVQVSFPGFSGESITLEVSDGGRLLQQQEVELPVSGDETIPITVDFRTQAAGTRSLSFRLVAATGAQEAVTRNNQRSVLLEVEEGPHKILYFEGEPRFEYKFIRRAVEDDPQVQLVSLLRMADNRFYRQSVDGEDELLGGFPTRREDLFSYRGLVLGSVEASFFNYEQMRMIVDFASERGGGVLFLGGSQSLGEGGYAGTPLSELVPVELSDRRQVGPRGVAVKVSPTQLGNSHSALQLGQSEEQSSSDAFWQNLPELLLLNETGRLKSGAGALLMGRSEALNEERLVLAHQRFGAGSSMLFTPTDSFRWQMRMDVEDQTHEVLWRQLLRWLINGVDERIVASTPADRVDLGASVPILANVRDGRFSPDSNALVEARITPPSGVVTTVELRWDPKLDGIYQGVFESAELGIHQVEVSAVGIGLAGGAAAGERTQGTAHTSFEVAALDSEFFDPVIQSEVIQRLADESGGEVFTANEFEQLFDRLTYSTSGVTVREDRPLWNMPILFLLLLLALFSEWSVRRWKGLR